MSKALKDRGVTWPRVIVLVSVLALFAAFATTASAVHNVGVFELDTGTAGANATTDHSGTALPDDWDRVCRSALIGDGATATAANAACSTVNNANTTDVSWKVDGKDATIFTGGGSKDDLDIDQWAWKNGASPDKDDLLNAFAARYTCSTGCDTGDLNSEVDPGDQLLYFGADRFDNGGDAQMGFWFLQGHVAITGTGKPPGSPFGPDKHTIGDLLILSDFTNGGGTPTIRVFMWDPTHTPASELVNGALLPLGGSVDSPAGCGTDNNDDFCANVNSPSTGTTTSPWSFRDKKGNTGFADGELYEGGVNLSKVDLPGGGTLADECFASYVAETRSSQSVDATLEDFVADSFQPCESGIVTTPGNATVTAGSTNTDGAVVTGTGGGTPTGTVTFFICSPSETVLLNGNPTCPDPAGTQVGSPVNLTPVTATTATATSAPTAALNTVGTWCFRGVYNPGIGSPYDPATDASTTECFEVVTIPTSTTTSQSWFPNDSATVTTTGPVGYNLTGSVTFSLFDNATCADPAGATGLLYTQTVNIPAASGLSATVGTTNGNGADGTDEAPADVAISASGTYSWLVVYTPAASDTAHTGSSSVCHDEHSALTITNNDPSIP